MLPRRIPFNQIAFVTVVGVGGGIYIYRPMFEPHRKTTSGQNEGDASAETGSKEQETGLTGVLVPGVKREAAAAEQ